MRHESEIVEKCRHLYSKYLKEMVDEYTNLSHKNCVYNKRHRVKGNGMVYFCHNPEVVAKTKRFVFVCDSEEIANKCDCYSCKNTEDSVQKEYEEIVKNPSKCGQRYPKLAVLLWCLQQEEPDHGTSRFGRLWASFWSLFSFRWW